MPAPTTSKYCWRYVVIPGILESVSILLIQKRKLELFSWLNVSSSFRSYWSSWNINHLSFSFSSFIVNQTIVFTFHFQFGKHLMEWPFRLCSIYGVRSYHRDRIDRIAMVNVGLCPHFKTLNEQRCCLWSLPLVGSLAVILLRASPNQTWFTSLLYSHCDWCL